MLVFDCYVIFFIGWILLFSGDREFFCGWVGYWCLLVLNIIVIEGDVFNIVVLESYISFWI